MNSTGPSSQPAGGDDRLTIGIDLGGTKLRAVVADSKGVVSMERRRPTPRGAEALLHEVLTVSAELEQEIGPADLGVGVPGLVTASGVLRSGPHLPGIFDLPLGEMIIANRPGRKLALDNDATGAMAGELLLGAAQGARCALLVAFGTGIGGGLAIGDEVVRGAHGFAGELGHFVVDPAGARCACGRKGCWEVFASGSALGSAGRQVAIDSPGGLIARLAAEGAVRGEHVTEAARQGDAQAIGLLEDLAEWIGLGLVNLVNVLDPDVIVLGGGLVEAHDVLLTPIRQAYERLTPRISRRPRVAVEVATLGELAGAVGASLLVRSPRHWLN